MRIASVIVLSIFLLTGTAIAAETLGEAYAKEFTFLKAQKTELEGRLVREASGRAQAERRARAEIEQLQSRFIDLSTQVTRQQLALAELQQDFADVSTSGDIIDGVLLQMESTLKPFGVFDSASADADYRQRLSAGFRAASVLISEQGELTVKPTHFYLSDGSRVSGQVAQLGAVATFGVSERGSGILLPAGEGNFRLWESGQYASQAKALIAGQIPTRLPMYTYENKDVEVTPPEKKSIRDTVESGGLIGYAILGLGALGIFMVILRFFILLFTGSARSGLVRKICQLIQMQRLEDARKLVRRKSGATARVMRDLLASIGLERERVDDIVSESILRESARLDRLGAMILVIAAVAPLLGLLGTVVGMIGTFEVITEFGTGDPKLLARGISVALVTTMLGLIVAIPLLLFGNMLKGWAQKSKDAIERNALRVVNEFEKHRTHA